MANIVNELDDILKAIRGEEVRQSIYRGMVGVNLQTERLEDVVGALNDAITAQTSVNVRSFVEKVENDIADIEDVVNGLWYTDGDEIAFNNCGNDYFMVPGLASNGGAQLSFTLGLPKAIKPSDSGYSVTIKNLTLSDTFDTVSPTSALPLTDIVVNGVLSSDVEQCVGYVEGGQNKLHIIIVPSSSSLSVPPVLFFNVSKLKFSITENSAS